MSAPTQTPPPASSPASTPNAATQKPRARKERSFQILFDLLGFLKQNKKWWLLPIFILFILMTVVILFAATEAAPFIYTIF